MSRSVAASSPAARLHRALALALASALAITALGAASDAAARDGVPSRDEQLRFMWAMAGQESGWDYYARNRTSGAFGKYQIMPFNWPAWAGHYLGDRQADQTPYNQEKVAFGKLRDLYGWLGSWKRVAYWWLTGSSEKDERKWSSYAKGYVRNIMLLRQRAPAGGMRMPPRTSSAARAGDWRRSGEAQVLRLALAGRAWPARGRIRDGEVLRVRGARSKAGIRWVRVVTADGRLGWLRQQRTVPAHRPAAPGRWQDVRDEGSAPDRRGVRPRPW